MKSLRVLIPALLLTVPACETAQQATGGDLAGQTIEIAGVWSGDEQRAFEQVLHLFERKTGAQVRYRSEGDNLPVVLQSDLAGGGPPDIAFLAQPNLIAQFARSGVLRPLPVSVREAVAEHEMPAWQNFATVDGTPYGVYFTASDKSVIWYNAKQFAVIDASPPDTWQDFLALSGALADAGITPMSLGAADGWVLTDWFEQIYLQVAGADRYAKLAKHQISWTDETVSETLRIMAQYLGQDVLVGGRREALQTDFPSAVVNTFRPDSTMAMVYGANFTATTITSSTKAEIGSTAKVFPFPRISSAAPPIECSGDAAVAFTTNRATTEFLGFLASPEAGAVLVGASGFLSPNKDMPISAYTNRVSRAMGEHLLNAGNNVVYDMSDETPSVFGTAKGSGEWKRLEDFIADPGDIAGAERGLEADARAFYP